MAISMIVDSISSQRGWRKIVSSIALVQEGGVILNIYASTPMKAIKKIIPIMPRIAPAT